MTLIVMTDTYLAADRCSVANMSSQATRKNKKIFQHVSKTFQYAITGPVPDDHDKPLIDQGIVDYLIARPEDEIKAKRGLHHVMCELSIYKDSGYVLVVQTLDELLTVNDEGTHLLDHRLPTITGSGEFAGQVLYQAGLPIGEIFDKTSQIHQSVSPEYDIFHRSELKAFIAPKQ